MASEDPAAATTAEGASTPTPTASTNTQDASSATTPAAASAKPDDASSSPAPNPPAATGTDEASSSTTPAPKKKIVKKNYSLDPALYIYTSLTAGNMHIVTATSRLETILRANRVPFKATDLATDEKARMLWGRRAGKAADGRPRRLPALVQLGMVLGDLTEIEEWNEYGELKQHVKIYYDEFTQPAKGSVAPVPKYKQPEDKAAHPPAALNIPPPPERVKSPAEEAAAQVQQAVKSAGAAAAAKAAATKRTPGEPPAAKTQQAKAMSVAEEAAAKAQEAAKRQKAARLQALREKVHGSKKEGSGDDESKSPGAEPPTEGMSQLSVGSSGAGLQSPTSGAWKESGSGSIGAALNTVQSPTSSSWKPQAESSLAADETFAGARVSSASAEEIQKVEDETKIKEEPEEDAEEDVEAQQPKDKAEEKIGGETEQADQPVEAQADEKADAKADA